MLWYWWMLMKKSKILGEEGVVNGGMINAKLMMAVVCFHIIYTKRERKL
jgi:hypothetical protein